MKFISFSLAPYPELPDDFVDRYRSIWVDLDPKLFDPMVGHWLYNNFIDMHEFADSLGFDGIGVNEHHSNAYGLQTSPNLIASALARSTKNAAIVIMGNSVALYNPPMRVAEEIAMIDLLSGGRVVAGFPLGTPMDTCFAYGLSPASVRDRYYEAVDLILRAWKADEPFSYNGTYNKFRYVNVWPRPLQQPHPPVWIPGGGSVDTWEWCAREEHPFMYLTYYGYKLAEKNMKAYWRSVAEHGFEPNPFKAGLAIGVAVADSEREARDLYREGVEYFFNTCLNVYDGFADPPGYKSDRTLRAGIEGMVQRAAREASERKAERKAYEFHKRGLTFDEIVDKGYIIVGSPEQVTEKLYDAATSLNFGHLLLSLHHGNMSRELAHYNVEMVATKVMPELKNLFADQWEDLWWPKPVPLSERIMADPTFGPAPGASPIRAIS